MKKTMLNVAIMCAFMCCTILPFTGCDTGSSNDTSDTSSDTTGGTTGDTTGGTTGDTTGGTTGDTTGGTTGDTTGGTTGDTTGGTTGDTTGGTTGGTTGDTTGGTTGDTTGGTTGDTTGGTTGDTTGGTTTPADTSKIGFEVADFSTISGAFTQELGDMNKAYSAVSSEGTFAGDAERDMVMLLDSSTKNAGAASLKATAKVRQNHWSGDVMQWAVNAKLSTLGFGETADLTGKTVTLKVYIPSAGTLTAAKLVFMDSNYKTSQGKTVMIDTKGEWATVTYKYADAIPAVEGGSATSDYTAGGFDIRKVMSIRVIALKTAGIDAEDDSTTETLYIDSIDWD